VRLYNLRDSGRGIAFTLKVGEPSELRQDWRGRLKLMPRYQRKSTWERLSTAKGFEGVPFYPTVPGAVCWHGHRDFLRALYAKIPDAKVHTAFITYLGASDFERRHLETWDGAPGSSAEASAFAGARPYQDACTCEEK